MEPLKSPVAAQTVTSSEDRWAPRLRGFGPFGILVMLVVPFAGTAFIGAVLVLRVLPWAARALFAAESELR